MSIAYLVITILLAAIVTFSGIGKIRRDPHIVRSFTKSLAYR